MRQILSFYNKHRQLVLYAFFGGLTTVVNICSYFILSNILYNLATFNKETAMNLANIIAIFLAVVFAYLTNRKLVFESTAKSAKEITREVISFFSCRAFTMLVDIAIMNIFVTLLGFNDLIIKIFANVIVIVLNYIFSKLIIFKKQIDK